jgi:hypothetical protein
MLRGDHRAHVGLCFDVSWTLIARAALTNLGKIRSAGHFGFY